jgi:hypothetical protein
MKTLKSIINLILLVVVLSIIFSITLNIFNYVIGGLLGITLACAVTIVCLFKLAK